jgi:hypothetical protein
MIREDRHPLDQFFNQHAPLAILSRLPNGLSIKV